MSMFPTDAERMQFPVRALTFPHVNLCLLFVQDGLRIGVEKYKGNANECTSCEGLRSPIYSN